MATELVTIKVTKPTRVMLRLLAAYSSRDMAVELEQVLQREVNKKKIDVPGVIKGLGANKKGSTNGRRTKSK